MLWLNAKFLFGQWMNNQSMALSVQHALSAMGLEADADEPMEVMARVHGPSFVRWVVLARAIMRGFDILLVRRAAKGHKSPQAVRLAGL